MCVDKSNSISLDFILVDAPGGAGNNGTRNSKVGNDFLKQICKSCAVVIIDDTHRKTEKVAFNELKESLDGDYFQVSMNYPVAKVMNEITFLIQGSYYSSFSDFVSLLGLDCKISS